MSELTRRKLCGVVALLASPMLGAQSVGTDLWFESLTQEQGRHRFKFWGFEVYDAVLRVGPGFEPLAYERHPMALALTYARTFKGADIARRSIDEIERQLVLEPNLRSRWLTQLTTIFPDVEAGDTLLGAYRPGQKLQFWRRGTQWQWVGELNDPELARRFMGIWLAPQTSQAAMRAALLGLTPR